MERERAGGVAAREGRGRPEREQGVRGGSRPGGARASGSEAEGEERKEGGREKKKRKREKGRKKKWEKGKRNRGKENGREGKEKEGGGERWCAPAATATAVGHAWRAAAGGGARGRRGERKKEGRDSRRPVTTRRVGWEKDGTRIEFWCRVARERLWGLGFRV